MKFVLISSVSCMTAVILIALVLLAAPLPNTIEIRLLQYGTLLASIVGGASAVLTAFVLLQGQRLQILAENEAQKEREKQVRITNAVMIHLQCQKLITAITTSQIQEVDDQIENAQEIFTNSEILCHVPGNILVTIARLSGLFSKYKYFVYIKSINPESITKEEIDKVEGQVIFLIVKLFIDTLKIIEDLPNNEPSAMSKELMKHYASYMEELAEEFVGETKHP